MVAAGKGAIVATGNTSALRGKAGFAGFAPTKAAQRILAEAMARDLGPKGVHVAHVVIDGQIDTPRMRALMPGRDQSTMLAPDAIAETYWTIHVQDKTCWTHELDIRLAHAIDEIAPERDRRPPLP